MYWANRSLFVVALTGLLACSAGGGEGVESGDAGEGRLGDTDGLGDGDVRQFDLGSDGPSADGGTDSDGSSTPTPSPFVGVFDCTFTAETFTGGGGSSGPADTAMTLIGTARPDSTVHWLSPGTRENLFQGCGTIMSVMGREATYVSGDNCDSSLTQGSATAADDDHFTARFDGTFGGFDIEVTLSCERRPEEGPEAFPNGFIGNWACSGQSTDAFNGMTMMAESEFGLEMMRIEDGLIRVRQLSGGGTIFAFCPAYFEATSTTFAELHERSDCDTIRGTPLNSQGLTLEGDTLSGDYGSEMPHVSSHLVFGCTRN